MKMAESTTKPEVEKIEPTKTNDPVSKKVLSEKNKIYITIAAFLGISIIITILAIVFTLLYGKKGSNKILINTDNTVVSETSIVTSTISTTGPVTPTVAPTTASTDLPSFTTTSNLTSYNIFYNKDNGIYGYNITSGSSVKIIDNASLNFNLGNNKLVIEQYYSTSDYTYTNKYYLANLTTQNMSLITNYLSDYRSKSGWVPGFYSESSYLVEEETHIGDPYVGTSKNYKIVENNITTDLGVIGYLAQRGISYQSDSIRYLLSPDGNNFIISNILVNDEYTAEIRPIFIINKNTKTILTIDDAKMPLWLDSTHVLYQALADNRLYVFNITSGTSSIYTDFTANMSDKYGLHKSGNKFVYWKDDNATYIYDITTNAETLLIPDATDARFYNDNYLVYSKIVADEDRILRIKTDNLWLYNLSTNSEVQIADNVFISSELVISTDRGSYICESANCLD